MTDRIRQLQRNVMRLAPQIAGQRYIPERGEQTLPWFRGARQRPEDRLPCTAAQACRVDGARTCIAALTTKKQKTRLIDAGAVRNQASFHRSFAVRIT